MILFMAIVVMHTTYYMLHITRWMDGKANKIKQNIL
jgi:hypothetical protein